ncbi:HAD family hydrolase [Hydrogenimonas sp.]
MKTVIFDLDGTLVDSHEDITASINHVRRELYGLPPLSTAVIVEKMNAMGLNLAWEFYGVEAYEEAAKELFEAHYAVQCVKNARCYEGIEATLEELESRNCDLFVATNAPRATSEIILKNNNIDRFFTDIIGADCVKHAKPHPEMIHAIAGRARFEELWMVGDSARDALAAQRAGARPIFAAWGYTPSLPGLLGTIPTARTPSQIVAIAFTSS